VFKILKDLRQKGLSDLQASDSELVERFIKGDENAFRVLYKRYVNRIFSMAYRFCRDYETSKDITQEVFLRLYQKKEKYSPEVSFNTFFYRLAYNCILNYIRDHRTPPVDEWTLHQISSKPPTPEENLSAIEMGKKIEKVLDELPEKQKTAFILNKIEGLSYNEIAEVMNINLNLVKSLIHRATLKILEVEDE
jgi:RNA polymerase sigma-70 factor (ECF subfamily)